MPEETAFNPETNVLQTDRVPGILAFSVNVGIHVLPNGKRMVRIGFTTMQGFTAFIIPGEVAVPVGQQIAEDGRKCDLAVGLFVPPSPDNGHHPG
jgi:hypothetical protein